jgi:hypothetical protein
MAHHYWFMVILFHLWLLVFHLWFIASHLWSPFFSYGHSKNARKGNIEQSAGHGVEQGPLIGPGNTPNRL